MNLHKINEILSAANVANMDKIVIKSKNSQNTVHGVSPDEKIVLYSQLSGEPITPKDMGIHKVSTLLARLKLVDFEKSAVTANEDETFLKSITTKQGRKKFDYTFADPAKIRHPQGIQQDEIKSRIVLEKDQAQELLTAITAMSPEYFTLEGVGDDVVVRLYDGGSDYFENKVGSNAAGDWKWNWDVTAVTRLLKHTIKDEDSVELSISAHGFLYMLVSGLTFLVVPEVQR